MEVIKYPNKADWSDILKRPTEDSDKIEAIVSEIMAYVKERGDQAILELTEKIDGIKLESSEFEVSDYNRKVEDDLKNAIQIARQNIEKFHTAQKEPIQKIETSPGVTCWRKSVPIESVGLYVPGGSAPLFSTLLMLAIPALIAGSKNLVVCTPPDSSGSLHPVIGYVCEILGIKNVYLVGGAQAIAGMTYGTDSIRKVDKIFGPGNRFVTLAKQLAQKEGVAIDMPAGPSEVLVIADDSSSAEFVAADLLSQAEHGTDSQALLVSTSEKKINEIKVQIEKQLKELPRVEIAKKSLDTSKAVLVNDLNEAFDISNSYAPEHLILSFDGAEDWLDSVVSAGSVFVGKFACESAGDYASGTNHTLPTNGYAAAYSGVSLDSFMKKITFQTISKEGIQNLGPTIEKLAEAEELIAHKNAVTLRLNDLKNG